MRKHTIYYVYDGDQLKLSTIDESEANDYVTMYRDFTGVDCEKLTEKKVPANHTNSEK